MPASARSRVDLPAPEAPVTTTSPPAGRSSRPTVRAGSSPIPAISPRIAIPPGAQAAAAGPGPDGSGAPAECCRGRLCGGAQPARLGEPPPGRKGLARGRPSRGQGPGHVEQGQRQQRGEGQHRGGKRATTEPGPAGQHGRHRAGGGQVRDELPGPLPGGPAAARPVGGAETLAQLGQRQRAGPVGGESHPAIQHFHQPGLRGRPGLGQLRARPAVAALDPVEQVPTVEPAQLPGVIRVADAN